MTCNSGINVGWSWCGISANAPRFTERHKHRRLVIVIFACASAAVASKVLRSNGSAVRGEMEGCYQVHYLLNNKCTCLEKYYLFPGEIYQLSTLL